MYIDLPIDVKCYVIFIFKSIRTCFSIDGSLGSYDTSLAADKFRSEPYHSGHRL